MSLKCFLGYIYLTRMTLDSNHLLSVVMRFDSLILKLVGVDEDENVSLFIKVLLLYYSKIFQDLMQL